LSGVRRLNWGCGEDVQPVWINCDVKDTPGVDMCCDIRQGLPLDDDSLDYAVSIHALPEIPYDDLIPVLCELRRVLKPGATLWLALPDLQKSVAAFERRDREYFLLPDEEWTTLGGQADRAADLVRLCEDAFRPRLRRGAAAEGRLRRDPPPRHRQTATRYPEIVELDNREQESLFAEAVK
jgi:SAM-dependent methyltransferase